MEAFAKSALDKRRWKEARDWPGVLPIITNATMEIWVLSGEQIVWKDRISIWYCLIFCQLKDQFCPTYNSYNCSGSCLVTIKVPSKDQEQLKLCMGEEVLKLDTLTFCSFITFSALFLSDEIINLGSSDLLELKGFWFNMSWNGQVIPSEK